MISGETESEDAVDEEGNWVLEQMFRPRTVFPAPPIIVLPEDLPRHVRLEVQSAFQLFWSDLGASASRLRTSVERVLDDFKIPKSKANGKGFLTLDQRINAFKAVDATHAETFDALRHVGNVGTHLDELKREALLDSFDIYEDALSDLYAVKKHKIKIDALKKKIIAAKGKYT